MYVCVNVFFYLPIPGNMIYDFFMGHELNPRIGPIDLKFFCELRPGLIGWVILDLCFIAKACQLYEAPPAGLVVVCLFHICYVADALWFEVRWIIKVFSVVSVSMQSLLV